MRRIDESAWDEVLRAGAADVGLLLDPLTRERLLAFLRLLHKWNGVYNLTAIRDPGQMLIQHLLDSLAIVPALRRRRPLAGASIADIGSGGGLPGLPIAIVEPTATIVSIEPVGKKAAFQRQACAELALTNVEIYAERAETIRRPVDIVVCRAFASIADFMDAAAGLTGADTLLVAMKGQRAELDAELVALPPGHVIDVERITVPHLAADRHLVFIRRAAASSATAAA